MNNMRSIYKIVENTLREAWNKKWDFNEFIVMGTWKPKKKNLCNNCFMGCIRKRNERISDPDKWFSYVVVKGPLLYNEQDRKIPHRVGDYMEYADIAKEQNMEIDINYYLGITVEMYMLCLRSIFTSDVAWPKLPAQNYNALNFMAGIIHLTHFSCNLRQESIWGITYIRFINEDDKYQLPLLHKIIQLKDSDEKEKQIDQYS